MYVRYFASLWYKRIYLGLSLAQVRLMEKELTNLQPWRRKLQTVQSQTGALKQ